MFRGVAWHLHTRKPMKYWILPVFVGVFGVAVAALGQPGHERGSGDARCAPPHALRGHGAYEHHRMMEERRSDHLERFDLDQDGRLDRSEFRSMHRARQRERFDMLDTNSDGVVSLDEFEHGAPVRPAAR